MTSDREVAGAVQRPVGKNPLHLAVMGVLMGARPVAIQGHIGLSTVENTRIKALADALADTQRSDSDEPAK